MICFSIDGNAPHRLPGKFKAQSIYDYRGLGISENELHSLSMEHKMLLIEVRECVRHYVILPLLDNFPRFFEIRN